MSRATGLAQIRPDVAPVPGSTTLGVELRHLRAFVAVAEELHFTRAAERLFLGQQALSSQIRQLESLFGASLFSRTTRRVQLTPAGEALLEYAPAVLSLVEEGWRGAQGVAAEGRIQVSVGYTTSVSTLPEFLGALRRQAPHVRLTAQEAHYDDVVHGVRHGRYDAGFLRAAPRDPGLESVLVGREPFRVTLGASHPLAERDIVQPDDLASTVLTMWPREHAHTYDLIASMFPSNMERGLVYEYENSSRDGFLRDPHARAEILSGRAFTVRLVPPGTEAPPGFVDVDLAPPLFAKLYLVNRAGETTSLGSRRGALETMRRVALAMPGAGAGRGEAAVAPTPLDRRD